MKAHVFLFLPHQRPWNYSGLISYFIFLGSSFFHLFLLPKMLYVVVIVMNYTRVSFSHTSYKKSPHRLLSHQYFMRISSVFHERKHRTTPQLERRRNIFAPFHQSRRTLIFSRQSKHLCKTFVNTLIFLI